MAVQDPLFSDIPVDFRDMLTKPIGEWESAPMLPMGHYFGECVDVLTGLSRNKGTRYFGFICQPREFCSDIPMDARKGIDLSNYEFPRRDRLGTGLPAGQIWISPGAMPMNREFFTSMGFSESKPMDECIVEMRGRKVLMEIGRDSYETAQGQTRTYHAMTGLAQDPR